MVILSFLCIQAVSADSDIYVGLNTTVDGQGTIDNPYNNLKLALDNAGDNVRINIQSGTYNGVNNSDLTVSVNNLTITSYNGPVTFTPAFNATPSRYLNITGNNIVLNGLTFISGVSMLYENTTGGDVIISAKNVIVNNTIFMNSISQGGSLYVTADNTIIQNSVFNNNTVNVGNGGGAYVEGNNLTVINSVFISNRVNNGAGGAIYYTGKNLIVNRSSFVGNNISAHKGGALYVDANSVKIFDSIFINQTASSASGGALYCNGDELTVVNTTFSSNKANGGIGGAIEFKGTTLIVDNSSFIKNTVQGKSGASIYSDASELVVLNNSYFDENQAWGGAGGALYNNGKTVVVDNSTFSNHITTQSLGAGVIYTIGDLNVTNSSFIKNYGYAGVGCIHQENGNLYFKNNFINGSEAWNNYAGVIYTVNSNSTVNNNTFISCLSHRGGGVVYAENCNATISNNIFDKCYSNNGGGALHLIGDYYYVVNCSFSNTPSFANGFVYVTGNNNIFDHCNFTNGYAYSHGGAILSMGDNLSVINCNMNNINTSSMGGMIYSIGNNTFIENSTFNKSLTGTGVIYLQGDNPIINNITLSNVESNVGALHIRGSNVTVTNSLFDKCLKSSYGNGGALFWTGTVSTSAVVSMPLSGLYVDNCTFVECTGEGGFNTALTAFGSNVTVNNSNFHNCSSPYAASLYFRGTNATINACNFDGGEAAVYAGAINMAGSNVTVQYCNFTNNYAMMYGGAIYSSASNSLITHCLFVNNTVGSDGTKHLRGKNYNISIYPGDGGSIMLMGGSNINLTYNTICNASMVGFGGGIENRARGVFINTTLYNLHVHNVTYVGSDGNTRNTNSEGGAIMNYGYMEGHNNTVDNCSADGIGDAIMNRGVDGPVYMILDTKERYIYVNETTWIPIGLVNDMGVPVTVNNLVGVITENNTHTQVSFTFTNNGPDSTSGFYMKLPVVGNYTFTPNALQHNVFLASDNILRIVVVDSMPVEIVLPDITAYPNDIVENYTVHISNPNGILIRNGTLSFVIKNNNFTAVIDGNHADINVHDLEGIIPDISYTSDYINGSITFKNIHLYDEANLYNITAYYLSNGKYYANATGNGTINILHIPTFIPTINIDAYVRDQVTFSIDVKSVTGREVNGNVSFYLPYILANTIKVQNESNLLAISIFDNYPGLLFTVKLHENITITIPVESNFTLPIFYNGDDVFADSIGILNISSHRNPTVTEGQTVVADVGELFTLSIHVGSEKYIVDENIVRVIISNSNGMLSAPNRFYDVPISEGYVNRTFALYMPGTYVYPVIYVGGQSFIGSEGVVIVKINLVNLTIDVDDINTYPGDIINITVNLTDKFGQKVQNGTVNTTINGNFYEAIVSNGTATFKNVILNDVEGEYNFTVYYAGNEYYESVNITALINLTKISTDLYALNIIGLPGDNKTLNITLTGRDGNIIDGTIKITLINSSTIEVNVNDTTTIILPNPDDYIINITFAGNTKYNPSYASINVSVLKLNTTTVSQDITAYPGKIVNILANISDQRENPVKNGTATIIVDGVNYYGDVINGVVTFTDVKLPITEDIYEYVIDYLGNDYYNHSNTSISITISKIDTEIKADNVSGRSGVKVNITANITDVNGNKINNGTVLLNLNNNTYLSDVINGIAIFENVTLTKPGNYTANILYSGDTVYNESNTTINVNVLKLDTNITSNDVNGLAGDIINITANLTDINGNPVKNGTAKLIFGEDEYESNINDGKVIFENVILKHPDNDKMFIKYDETDYYYSSNTQLNVNISKLDTNITFIEIEGKTRDKINIITNVTDIKGNPVKNGTATLIINGTRYTANVSDGKVTFENVILPIPDNYTANIVYDGNKYYNPSNTTIIVKTLKLDTVITSDDVTGYPGDIVTIVADVIDENSKQVNGGIAILIIGDKIAESPNGLAAAGEYSAQVINGKATFNDVTLPDPGVYPGNLMYLGNEVYNPSNGTLNINVLKVPTAITANDVIANAGDKTNITVEITDKNGNPVKNGTATLIIDGVEYHANVIDGNAIFTDVILPNETTHAQVIYEGNDYYDSCELLFNIVINQNNYSSNNSSGNNIINQNLDKNATGNPIFLILFVLLIFASNSVFRRKK